VTDKQPNYKWPRYVLAAVILFLVSALVWVTIEVCKVKQEHNFSAPMQGQ
jgi:hypothetical protein